MCVYSVHELVTIFQSFKDFGNSTCDLQAIICFLNKFKMLMFYVLDMKCQPIEASLKTHRAYRTLFWQSVRNKIVYSSVSSVYKRSLFQLKTMKRTPFQF